MKQTSVTLKASHFPYPCVVVSGPRCLIQKAQADLNTALASLKSDTLFLKGPGVQQYFQREGKASTELVESSCQVVITEQQQAHSQNTATVAQHSSFNTASMSTSRQQCSTPSSTPNTTTVPLNKTTLEVRLGSLVDEQVHVLVAPMVSRKLTSTKIGKCLLSKGRSKFQNNFDKVAGKWTLTAGNVMQLDAPSSLGCSKIFFIECLPWDGVRGRSMQVLGNGLKRCLDLCVKQGWCSVALPVIGPGKALQYPLREAIQVLTDEIHRFGSSASCGSLSTIHVVIKPDYPDSVECYHDVYRHLSMNMNQAGKAIFRSLTSDLDDITVTVGGGVKLQVVFGDISDETTDAVVNTTDFINLQTGVCRDILSVAGPQVEDELRKAKVNRGDVLKTRPGSFPCKAILHVGGEKDVGLVDQLVCRIIQLCESSGYKSVAIPAICAGAGGLDTDLVARVILRGINITASSSPLLCLTNIRLVLIKIKVFLAFKKQVMQMFPSAAINTEGAAAPQQPPPQAVNIHPSILCTSSTVQQSVFTIAGLCKKNVDNAMTILKSLYQSQCTTQTFRTEELAGLTQDEVNDLKQLIEDLGVLVEEEQSGRGLWTVSGLKDGVNQVMQMIHKSAM
ncbi:uncharacterized protein LOC103360591 [Stegastes partitus]|uniref:Uncharacterized LOC103360591 n=1 Tax=Stegastes partitus TaxID=144197 RepID=A0A3B4ZIM9_9TELE|nr:PREDICTED: uncharacterized protein LOC103360591 [Stegastes partitus]